MLARRGAVMMITHRSPPCCDAVAQMTTRYPGPNCSEAKANQRRVTTELVRLLTHTGTEHEVLCPFYNPITPPTYLACPPYSPSEICVCTRQGAPVFTSTRTTYYPSRSGSSRRAPATRTACAGRTRCVPRARAPFHLTSYQFPTVSRPNHACRTPGSRSRFEEADSITGTTVPLYM